MAFQILRNSKPTGLHTLDELQAAIRAETEDVALFAVETTNTLHWLFIGSPRRGVVTVTQITDAGVTEQPHADREAAIADLIAHITA